MTTEQEPFQPGALVGPYRIVRVLGRGGMGVVYETVHIELNKRFALKALHAGGSALPAARVRFMLEAQTAARTSHPHIVEVTGRGHHEGTPYLVMEYLDGESLDLRLHRDGPLDVATAIDLMLPVLAAVQHLHEAGVIHCDLKPANIFLARDPYGDVVPKVIDFGIARRVAGARAGNADALDGLPMGTPGSMSPEQLAGSALGPATDQFSLGVILYRCLTACRPFRHKECTFAARMRCGAPPSPRSLVPSIPPHLDAVVRRTLHDDPAHRFESVRALAIELFPYGGVAGRAQWGRVYGRFAALPTTPMLRVPQALLAPTAPVAPSTQSVPLGAQTQTLAGAVVGAPHSAQGADRRLRRFGLALTALCTVLASLAMRGSRHRTTPRVSTRVLAQPSPHIVARLAFAPPSAPVVPRPPEQPPAATATPARTSPRPPAQVPRPGAPPNNAPRVTLPPTPRPRKEAFPPAPPAPPRAPTDPDTIILSMTLRCRVRA